MMAYEKLSEVHRATRVLLESEDPDKAIDESLKAVHRILEVPTVGFLTDNSTADDPCLVVTSVAGEAITPFEPGFEFRGQSIIWDVFEKGDPCCITDFDGHECVYLEDSIGGFQSLFVVPSGRYGVFCGGSIGQDAFDERDQKLAELLIGNLTNVLERIHREHKLRERERELTHENQRLDEFASVVSHDLTGLLNAAQGRLNMALEDPSDRSQLTEVDYILSRIQSTVEESVELARKGEAVGETETVYLPKIARQAWRGIETEGAELDIKARSYSFQADKDRLYHVFENIYRNAVDHAGGEPTISVGTLRSRSGFFIEDDGQGIPERDLDSVFDPGFTTSQEGTGLGLAIAYRIAEAHGWNIDVMNGSSGGARFEITGIDFGNRFSIGSEYLQTVDQI